MVMGDELNNPATWEEGSRLKLDGSTVLRGYARCHLVLQILLHHRLHSVREPNQVVPVPRLRSALLNCTELRLTLLNFCKKPYSAESMQSSIDTVELTA